MKVYVVTGLEFGWDCVVGVFLISSDKQLEDLKHDYPESSYIIHEQTVEVM